MHARHGKSCPGVAGGFRRAQGGVFFVESGVIPSASGSAGVSR